MSNNLGGKIMGTQIKQNGYDFTYIFTYNGQAPVVETWSLERVAGYMYLVEMHRQHSQKYTKDRTYMNRYGSQVYVFDNLEFDAPTNKDIDRIVKQVNKNISDSKLQEFWLMPTWKDALDSMEKFIKEMIASAEKSVEVMGSTYTPPKFLSRMSEEEYKVKAEEERKEQEAQAAALRQERVNRIKTAPVTTSSSRNHLELGQTLKFNFIKHGVLECKVIGFEGRSYICEAYKDGKVVDAHAKIGFTSKRIVG